MKKFIVKALSVGGRGSKIYKAGDVVSESDFKLNQIQDLVDQGFLVPVGEGITQTGEPVQHRDIPNIQRIYSEANTTVKPISKSKKPIELSVVLPFFRAKHIGWIPFESLTRQEGISFKWEVIIIEEDFNDPYEMDSIMEYAHKLKQVGCSRITYISIKEWIPLSAKWYYLFQQMDPRSLLVACNSADIYMSKHRLNRQHAAIKQGYDWHKLPGNIIYDIKLDKHVKLYPLAFKRGDACCAAISSKLVKQLPLVSLSTGVDGWRHRQLKKFNPKFYFDQSDIWMDTVNINGLNNISMGRRKRIENVEPPLSACRSELTDHMPMEVIEKLREAAIYVNDHTYKVLNSNIKL